MSFDMEALWKKLEEIAQRLKLIEKRVEHLEQEQGIEVPEESIITPPQQKPEPCATEQESFEPKPELETTYAPIDWKSLELRVGKYWLQIVGVIVFVIGMGFFIKYAIDQELISPTVRMLSVFCVATLLLGLGEYFAPRLQQWSLALTAGSVVIYYAGFFGSYLYQLIAEPLAAAGFICVTILALCLAIWHNSRVIALFACIGGFYAPVFLNVHNMPIHYLIPGYIILLALSFTVLSIVKNWYSLVFISMILYQLDLNHFVSNVNLQLLLQCSFFIVFAGIPFMSLFISKQGNRIFEPVIMIIAGLVTFIGIYNLLLFNDVIRIVGGKQYLPARLWLIFGIIYLILTLVLYLKNSRLTYALASLSAFSFFSFLTVILLNLHGRPLFIGLALYGFIIWLIGIYLHQKYVRYVAYGVLITSFVLMCAFAYDAYAQPTSLIFNELNFATALVIILCGTIVYVCTYYAKNLQPEEREWIKLLGESAALITIGLWFHSEVLWSAPYPVLLYSLGLGFYALTIILLGLIFNKYWWRIIGYVLYVLAFGSFVMRFFNILPHHPELLHAVIISMGASLAALVYVFFCYSKKNETAMLPAEQQYVLPLAPVISLFFGWFAGYTIIKEIITDTAVKNMYMAIYFGIAAFVTLRYWVIFAPDSGSCFWIYPHSINHDQTICGYYELARRRDTYNRIYIGRNSFDTCFVYVPVSYKTYRRLWEVNLSKFEVYTKSPVKESRFLLHKYLYCTFF